jgi:hypothetical protein
MERQPPADVRPGHYKTFGEIGPVYEVTGYGHASTEGEWLVPIRVVESGEEVEYRYSHFVMDPDAQ